MDGLEFLLSYGRLGDFGRFRSARPLGCRRGDRAVVRTHRGLEIGEVLRAATPHHATFLPNTSVGQLLRVLAPTDAETMDRTQERAKSLLSRAVQLGQVLALPLEVLDAEVLFDGEHAVLHLLRWEECDVRPFVSTLARETELHVALADLGSPKATLNEPEEEHQGCGREGCGSEKGGCTSCGTGGGCGTCGVQKPEEVQGYFAGLREKMDTRRTTLL